MPQLLLLLLQIKISTPPAPCVRLSMAPLRGVDDCDGGSRSGSDSDSPTTKSH